MFFITDLKGGMYGWTLSVHEALTLQYFKDLQLEKSNLVLLCPTLIDFIYPNSGELELQPGECKSFSDVIFVSPDCRE